MLTILAKKASRRTVHRAGGGVLHHMLGGSSLARACMYGQALEAGHTRAGAHAAKRSPAAGEENRFGPLHDRYGRYTAKNAQGGR